MPFNKHKKASSPVEQKSIKSGASCHCHVMGHLDALRIGVLTKGTNAQAKERSSDCQGMPDAEGSQWLTTKNQHQ